MSMNDECKNLLESIQDRLRQSTQHENDAKKLAQAKLDAAQISTGTVWICPECRERFLVVDDGAKCYYCGYIASGEDAATAYLENILGISAYECVKDGGEFPLYDCPECDEHSLAWDNEHNKVMCFACAYQGKAEDYSFCEECGTLMSAKTYFCVCDNCLQYRIDNDKPLPAPREPEE